MKFQYYLVLTGKEKIVTSKDSNCRLFFKQQINSSFQQRRWLLELLEHSPKELGDIRSITAGQGIHLASSKVTVTLAADGQILQPLGSRLALLPFPILTIYRGYPQWLQCTASSCSTPALLSSSPMTAELRFLRATSHVFKELTPTRFECSTWL